MNYRRLWLTQHLHQFIQIAHDGIEQLVHQLGFYHFGDVRDDAFAGTGHPTGFGVGTAAAREYEHAGIGPLQRFQIGRELALRERVMQPLGIFPEGPIGGVFVYIGPMETGSAMG